MAVEVFSGTVGSGKSLHAAQSIRFALKAGKLVIANFRIPEDAPADLSHFHFVPNSELTPEVVMQLVNGWWADGSHRFREGGVLLVLDECQLLFNARSWQQKTRMAWLEFMSQSRKYGVHVLLIAQGVKMIDNQFRMLVDIETRHFCVSSYGTVGWLLSLPFGGRLFYCIEFQYQINERMGGYLFRGSKRDCAMYDTHAVFDLDQK